MSTRFVAPPIHPHSTINPQNNPATPTVKNDYLPPPSHPALARRRAESPGPGGVGALNSVPVSRTQSPVPPIPQRTVYSPVPYADEPDEPRPSSQNTYASSMQPATSPNGYWTGSNVSQATSNSTVSPVVPTPTLLVTPSRGPNSNGFPNEHVRQPTEAVPPYSSQPDLPSQFNSVVTEPLLGPGTESSIYTNSIQQSPNIGRVPPPLHPSRQPSPSPTFIDAPGLRHRAHSSVSLGSARAPDAEIARPPSRLEHSRRGSGASILTLKDANLTDEDLRKMYDAEEIERYIRLFASRVSEVAIDPDHPDVQSPMQEDENDWISVSSVPVSTKPALPPNLADPQSPFEYAASIIYPYVAQSARPVAGLPAKKRKFKLSRAANASKRLYLALYPAYVPILVHLAHLSTWRDPRKSGILCAVYWAAWAAGLLSPLIVGRILYLLVTGGTVTREEIRRRREAAREAEILGRAIEGGIPGVGMHGDIGFKELTKLVTGIGKRKGKKAKAAAEEARRDESQVQLDSADSCEPDDTEDWKIMLVELAEELADLHERVKNIFIHRRPEVTRMYIIMLSFLFVATLFVQNTSKMITLGLGFFFWFVPPVVKLLPRLPPAFADAPTDAEVAMELISRRVARGERVVPERIAKRKKNKSQNREPNTALSPLSANTSASRSMLDVTDSSLVMSPSTASLVDGSTSDDDDDAEVAFVMPANKAEVPGEDKIRKGAVKAWNWFGRTRQMMDQVRGVQGPAAVWASSEQSFPAQHRSRPGMLTISATNLIFNPLFSSSATQLAEDTRTIKVDIDSLRGVKKATPGGLIVRFVKGSAVVEERFLFVVGRDEAFAMLVGWGGGRWKHV